MSLVSSKPEDLLQLLLIASPTDDCSNDKELLKTFSGFSLRKKLAPPPIGKYMLQTNRLLTEVLRIVSHLKID